MMSNTFDDIGLLFRQAQRRDLKCFSLNQRDGRFIAYAEFRENGVDRGYKREAQNIEEAVVAALRPGGAIQMRGEPDRLYELDRAIGELLGAIWDILPSDYKGPRR